MVSGVGCQESAFLWHGAQGMAHGVENLLCKFGHNTSTLCDLCYAFYHFSASAQYQAYNPSNYELIYLVD
jgi:hypothetical protein